MEPNLESATCLRTSSDKEACRPPSSLILTPATLNSEARSISPIVPSNTRTMMAMDIPSMPGTDLPRNQDLLTMIFQARIEAINARWRATPVRNSAAWRVRTNIKPTNLPSAAKRDVTKSRTKTYRKTPAVRQPAVDRCRPRSRARKVSDSSAG